MRPDEFGGAYYEAHHAKPAEGTLCLLEVESIKSGLTLASGEDCCVAQSAGEGDRGDLPNGERGSRTVSRRRPATGRIHVKPQARICVGGGIRTVFRSEQQLGRCRIPFDIEPQNAEQALSLVADILGEGRGQAVRSAAMHGGAADGRRGGKHDRLREARREHHRARAVDGDARSSGCRSLAECVDAIGGAALDGSRSWVLAHGLRIESSPEARWPSIRELDGATGAKPCMVI